MSRGDGQGSSGSHYIRGSQLRRHIGTDQIFIVLVFLGNLEGGGYGQMLGGCKQCRAKCKFTFESNKNINNYA